MESTAVISLWLQFVTVKKEIDSKLKCADKRVNATVQVFFVISERNDCYFVYLLFYEEKIPSGME